jgi:D-alanyl-D-alanine carboxypeptidase (penicillin-binding protein 5/6)
MRRYERPKRRFKQKFISFMLIVFAGGALINFARPLPHADASIVALSSQVDSVQLKWPTQGYAALGAKGYGVLATHGSQSQRPTASIAKLVTVLAVLEKHPIKPGQKGPTLTMTKADVDLFNKYFGMGGSYVKVEVGEKITLYQALQAILLPSANNMADSVAIWSFGSMENYHAYANKMLQRMGFKQTVVATDASGFSPDSKSTPSELVRLGEFAMNKPVVAEIVAQPTATIPVHGVIYSANSRLGLDGIIGIKTGLTDQAGGCFLFAANYTIEGQKVMLIGAIMGEPTLRGALTESEPLLKSAKPYFSIKTPIKAGETFATVTTKWQSTANVVAQKDVSIVAWNGKPITPSIELGKINGAQAAGTVVGSAIISSGSHTSSTPLVLKEAISGPTWHWRLQRVN